MDVQVLRAAPQGWDDLVDEDHGASFFHKVGWAAALREAGKGSETLYLTIHVEGKPAAGMPAVEVERGPVRILASMPVGTYGGLVLPPDSPAGASEALLETFSGLARGAGVAAAYVTDNAGRLPAELPGFEVHVEQAHRISLKAGYESVWAGFRPSARNKVRKARKAGVTVRRARSEADFLEYHDMLVECSARWGEACEFGPGFFSFLSSLDGDDVQMWLAEHDGTVIGGDLNFALHGRIMNWGNVSRDSARSLAPNNLLHAAAMEAGVEEGCVEYDLGASAGIEGVDAFKSAFGTSLVPLRRYGATKPWYRALRATARLTKHGGMQ